MRNSNVRAPYKQNMAERKATVRRQRIILGAVGALIALYLITALYFVWHFEPRSYVDGVDVSGLSFEKAKEKLLEVGQNYQLNITGPGNSTATFQGDELRVKVVDASNAKQCLRAQPKLTWLAAIFRDKSYQVDLTTEYDAEALSVKIDELPMLKEDNMVPPEDAHLQVLADGSYVIVPENLGTTLRTDTARAMIEEAVGNARPDVDLAPASIGPEVFADDENLSKRLAEWNAFLASAGLTYCVGDGQVVFSGSLIASLLDDDGEQVSLSYAKTADLMAQWKKEYDTYKCPFEFQANSGRTVIIEPYGDYGFQLDEESTCADVMEKINAHDTGTYDAQYFHKALYNSNKGLGGTYVEISVNRQHLWVYKDGEVVVDTDVVTGLPAYGRVTYYGCYSIKKKRTNVTLGELDVEGYASPVSYWLPFNSGEGIHDAPWRENFGGKIWLTNGSHGCVNVPEWIMKDVYDKVEVGEPVVVYGSEYDSTVNEVGNNTVDEDYYYRVFYGE